MVYFGECCRGCLLRLVLIFPVQAGVSCMWTNDTQRILLEYFDIISNSPSHLYHSALPLSPSSSWLHECYAAELSQEVRVVEGLEVKWGTCSRTVQLDQYPWTLSCWNNVVAVGSGEMDIVILDAITGSQTAVFPGHTNVVLSLTFSSDGASLVSGSGDKTVKLWDVQTGGVVKTFHGHTDGVRSVSISADSTTIASGSDDRTIRLWNIQVEECYQIIKQQGTPHYIRFSPTNPQTLISASHTIVQQWDIGGHKVGHAYYGDQVAFSPDGTQFVLCAGSDVTVQNINSGVAVAKFNAAREIFDLCCFSPDGRLVAISDNRGFHLWDITSSPPHLVETFIGHITPIISLAFSSPSNLISASHDESIKFWKIGASSADPVVTDPKSTLLASAPTRSITLKAKNSPIIPSDLPDGVMKTWGISAGCSKKSPQIPAQGSHESNIQPIDSKLIFVWYENGKINIWDTEKGKLLQTINVPRDEVIDLRVSGDGSKVFCQYKASIQSWDIGTSEAVGGVDFFHWKRRIIAIDGSKIQVTGFQGWDFGIPGSSPVELSFNRQYILHLNDTKLWERDMFRMQDKVTRKVVFELPERFGEAVHVQLGGQYLIVSLMSKVLVLDLSHTPLV